MKRKPLERNYPKAKRIAAFTLGNLLLIFSTSVTSVWTQAQEETPVAPSDRAVEADRNEAPPAVTPSTPGRLPTFPLRNQGRMNPAAQNSNSNSNSGTTRSNTGPTNARTPASNASKGTNTKSARATSTIESLDFKEAPIEDVVRAISRLTGKNFILDPNVKGRISIIAPSTVTVDEAYKAFLSALAISGNTVVPSGKFLKIMPARMASRDSIETYSTGPAPSSDQMVTRIIKMQHISVADVNKYLRGMVSKDGEMIGYDPTNSLIITDYGSNIRRILKIVDSLDKEGFEERLAVIPIRYAKAKDLAGMIDKIINKGGSSNGGGGPGGLPSRFGGRGPASVGGRSDGNDASLSLVTPDERTNSLIVLGNQEGIEKIRALVAELDFNLDPAVGGGVFVYRLKHSVAENVANTLNGLAQKATAAAQPGQNPAQGAGRAFTPQQPLFGGDVKIVPDKATNSLIIVAGKQDYDVVRGLVSRLDVPRDQVYVEAIIMEINTDKTRDWKVAGYYLDPDSNGVGRAGFSPGNILSLLNPANDAGAVIGFGTGRTFTIDLGGGNQFEIPSLIGLVSFLQRHADANILSTPQILAMDNEEAMIEVGDQVPIGIETQTTTGGVVTSAPRFDKATIKLTITPNISPESETVRLKVDQSVRQASEATVRAEALRDIATIISDRSLKTNIAVENQDTVVLGGLIRDEETRTEVKVPLLGDIPILGWLFKSSAVAKKKINLLIFLTPKIVRNNQDSRDLLGQKVRDRESWVKSNLVSDDPFAAKIQQILRAPPKPPPRPPQKTQVESNQPAAAEGIPNSAGVIAPSGNGEPGTTNQSAPPDQGSASGATVPNAPTEPGVLQVQPGLVVPNQGAPPPQMEAPSEPLDPDPYNPSVPVNPDEGMLEPSEPLGFEPPQIQSEEIPADATVITPDGQPLGLPPDEITESSAGEGTISSDESAQEPAYTPIPEIPVDPNAPTQDPQITTPQEP